MKILLISLNRETEPFTAAPLGLALVGAALKKAGHKVAALDLLFSEDTGRDLDAAVTGFGPGLIGLSIRNIESSTQFLLPSYREVVSRIRALSDAPVVAGGPAFSIMPKAVLEYLGLDYGVVGEGEEAAVGLAGALERGRDPMAVPGVCALRGGVYALNPRSPVHGLDSSSPDWGLLPASRYDMVGVQSKRGCSFGCVYCTYPALEGRRMRLKSPKATADEIAAAIGSGIQAPFYFVDNVFNNPKSHAEAVCRALTGRGVKASWGCLASPAGLDRSLVDTMRDAGCQSVEVGADSLSDRMLGMLGKNFKADDVKGAVRALKDASMMHMVFLILGGPGEDEGTLDETFEAIEEISPDKVFAVAGIRIYPGTPLAALAAAEGVIRPGDGLLEPAFYVSNKLGDDFYRRAEEFFGRHPGWLYYPARAVLDKKPAKAPAEVLWSGDAKDCLDKTLSSVPMLFRPIARKAVTKKASALAGERGLKAVTRLEIRDAFLSETPGPFQGPLKETLRKLGLLDA
jgi:radical SAM superfamily enzyme YgiQ (UPF0313 family)